MGLLKDIERSVKDIRGKDVPESPLRGHEDLKAVLQALDNLIEERAVELVKSGVDKTWDTLKGISIGEFKITRETYDIIVRAVVDSIIELGGDK